MDRIEKALAELRDKLPTIRKFAAINLGRYGDARAIPALEKVAWQDWDDAVRFEAARALANLRELGVEALAAGDLRVEAARLAFERARLVNVLKKIRDGLAARLLAPPTAGALLAPLGKVAPARPKAAPPAAPRPAAAKPARREPGPGM